MVLSGRVEKAKLAPKANPFPKYLSKEMVTVDVGGENGDLQTFAVHKNILCQQSSFFKAALMGRFKEAAAGKVELPEDRPELFDHFVQWIYTQDLKQVIAEATPSRWTTLFKLYVLADKLQVETLKNAIMDYVLYMAQVAVKDGAPRAEYPTNADISAVYENTPPASPMRKFLSELFALLPKFSIEKDEVSKDYLFDLAIVLRLHNKVSTGLPCIMKEPCRYHEHDSAEKRTCVYNLAKRVGLH
ncbi:hypothetical protein MMC16_004828 [Acarospora aff. strigata]|nr:hypothetical protein [Acarospora aff. strigata]